MVKQNDYSKGRFAKQLLIYYHAFSEVYDKCHMTNGI
jgi:hypothetical protein